jgi:hypothetical protein
MRSMILTCGLAVVLAVAAAAGQPKAASGQSAVSQAPAVNPIDRWNQMSPEERERELAKLPPWRARIIRERIRRYNQLPPAEKQALRERYQRFSQLPPEQQALVRRRLQEFRQLPLARRPVVRREVELLRALPEAERRARLNSEEFRTRFSPQEQEIVRDITEIFPQPPK